MKTSFTWLLINTFTIVILDMDSALHAEYCDVAQCGAFAAVKNYPMDGLATISNSMSLSRNLNYKQTQQIMPIWNGFHTIALIVISGYGYLHGLPTTVYIKLIPLEITDETHDLYYAEVNYLLMRHVY